MRLIGTFSDQHDAATLVDYLLTRNISARAERNGESWELWVLDEDGVPDAKRELTEFLANRGDEKYRKAVREAEGLRRERVEKALEARRNVVDLSQSAGRLSSRGRRPLTMMLLFASAAVFAITDFGQKTSVVHSLFISEVVPSDAHPAPPLLFMPEVTKQGQIWRIFTPMLIHLSIWHFVFNMFWLVDLGSMIESRRGTLVMAALVLFSGAVGHIAQLAYKGPAFGGMSGVVYGLFGYVLIKGRYEPLLGLHLPQQTIFVFIAWLFFCMTGAIGEVADAGHVGGLGAGMIFAYAPIALRELRRKS